jgi:hypothetical protein
MKIFRAVTILFSFKRFFLYVLYDSDVLELPFAYFAVQAYFLRQNFASGMYYV